jgi:hypothetical protein
MRVLSQALFFTPVLRKCLFSQGFPQHRRRTGGVSCIREAAAKLLRMLRFSLRSRR